MKLKSSRMFAPMLALVLAACGGGSTPTPPPSTTPDFAMTSTPSSLTVTQGSSGSVSINLDRQNGFAGAVDITLASPPVGVTAASMTITADSSVGTLNITADDTVTPGAITLNLTGVSGGQNKSSSLTLNVTAASSPDFVMALTPASLSLKQGSNGDVKIDVTRLNGFDDPITLSLTSPPAGVSAANIVIASGSSSGTMTVKTTANAALVSSNLNISAISGGLSHNAALALSVLDVSKPDFSLSLTPSSLTALTDSSADLNLTLTRVNGFSGAVDVTLTNPPAGFGANTVTIAAGSSTAKMTIITGFSAGVFPLTLTATGSGIGKTYKVTMNVSSPQPVDTTAPTVVSRIPANGASVPPSSKISVTFSEAMDTASLKVIIFDPTLLVDGNIGSPTWTNSNKTVTFTPQSALHSGSLYNFTVTGKDTSGNNLNAPITNFAVVSPADTTAPTVVSKIPADGATVLPSNKVSVTFSEPMDTASVVIDVFEFKKSKVDLGNPTWTNGNQTVTFTPPVGMAVKTWDFHVDGKDLAGNALTPSLTSFTVQLPPAPTIVSRFPANGTKTPPTSKIIVNFSSQMNTASVLVTVSQNFQNLALGNPVWTNHATTVTFTPPSTMGAFTYSFAVTGKDTYGTALTASTTGFTVIPPPDTTAPALVGSTPTNNAIGVSKAAGSSFFLQFSEAMGFNTQTAITLTPNIINPPAPVPFTCSFNGDLSLSSLTCTNTNALQANQFYVIKIGAGAMDQAGNAIAATSVFFKTGP